MQALEAGVTWVCILLVAYLVIHLVRRHKTSTAVAVARAQAEAAAQATGGDAAALARADVGGIHLHINLSGSATEADANALVAQLVAALPQQEAHILPPARPVVELIHVERESVK